MFLATTTRGAPNSVYEVTADSITVGTTLPYARAHQFGLGRMLQRKIYDLTEKDKKDLVKIAGQAYRKPIEDRGFDYKEGTGDIPF
jgi:hypothetical protein